MNSKFKEDSKDDKEKKERKIYKEKEIIKNFLLSEKGLMKLNDNVKRSSTTNMGTSQYLTNDILNKQIDELVDFYFGWINSFPVRKTMKISKYEFLKELENYCSKKEIWKLFEIIYT